jgi:hypothetical protein
VPTPASLKHIFRTSVSQMYTRLFGHQRPLIHVLAAIYKDPTPGNRVCFELVVFSYHSLQHVSRQTCRETACSARLCERGRDTHTAVHSVLFQFSENLCLTLRTVPKIQNGETKKQQWSSIPAI